MNDFVTRSFRIDGEYGLGSQPNPALVAPVLGSVHSSLRDAVRMGFLHSSRARGRVAESLRRASEVRLRGIDGEGDTATWLHFAVQPFNVAAYDLFRQGRLWEDGPKPEETAFELLGAALNDVAQSKSESDRYDPPLLDRFRSYRKLLRHGIAQIAMPDVHLPVASKIDHTLIDVAERLSAVTPAPQRVRVAGRLDTMGASEGVLRLDVRPGLSVLALWDGPGPIGDLREFFDRDVLIEGVGVFRPSGSLLRIDASVISPATADQEFFRRIPKAARIQQRLRKDLRIRSTEASAYAQIFGAIAGDESDEDFAAAVDALS